MSESVSHDFFLRPAEAADAEILFYWINQKDSISNMLSRNDPISWAEHVEWFVGRLNSLDTMIWIVVKDYEAAGQIRLDLKTNALEVSIYVDRKHRKAGLGRCILEYVYQDAADRWPGLALRARVKPQNRVSQALFLSAGFKKTSQEVDHLVFERNT